MSEEIIQGLIDALDAQEDYKTVIIGIIVGNEGEVKVSEKEFDCAIRDITATNGFIKLSGYSSKDVREE